MSIKETIEAVALAVSIVTITASLGIIVGNWLTSHDPDDVKEYLKDKLEPLNRSWLHRDWWAYIFAPTPECESLEERFRCYVCRWQGHPYNIVWSGIDRLEPYMCCSNCYDDLT